MMINKRQAGHPEGASVLDYRQITDLIYIGTNMCCQTHFDEQLLAEGIRGDISLEKERIDAAQGVDYYVWIPVQDKTPPTMDQLAFGVETIDHFVRNGKKVYVHCRNGHGRAPTVVAAYFIKHRGMTPDEAVEAVREKRPSIHLEDSQKQRLRQWHDSLSA